jgi:hypothetical protein
MEEPTTEESGPPVKIGAGTDAVIIVPPPLTLEQADKIAKAIEAIEAAIESLGTVGGAFARLLLGKVLEGLRAMGPIPPLGPSGGTEEPSTPPSTTP